MGSAWSRHRAFQTLEKHIELCTEVTTQFDLADRAASGEHEDTEEMSGGSETDEDTDEDPIQESITDIYTSLSSFATLSIKDRMEVWPKAGQAFAEESCFKRICHEAAELLSETNTQSFFLVHLEDKDNKGRTETKSRLEIALQIIVMVTDPDCSTRACEELLTEKTLLAALHDRLGRIAKNSTLSSYERIIVRDGLTIVLNLAAYLAESHDAYGYSIDSVTTATEENSNERRGKNKDHLEKMVDIFVQCRTEDHEEMRTEETKLLVITTLACIKETSMKEEDLQFLCLHLSIALRERSLKVGRCSITAMERGIRHLLTARSAVVEKNDGLGKNTTTKEKNVNATEKVADENKKRVEEECENEPKEENVEEAEEDKIKHSGSQTKAQTEDDDKHKAVTKIPNQKHVEQKHEIDFIKELVHCGVVRLLTNGAKSEFIQERKACLDSLRLLSFEKDYTMDVATDREFVDLLMRLYNFDPKRKKKKKKKKKKKQKSKVDAETTNKNNGANQKGKNSGQEEKGHKDRDTEEERKTRNITDETKENNDKDKSDIVDNVEETQDKKEETEIAKGKKKKRKINDEIILRNLAELILLNLNKHHTLDLKKTPEFMLSVNQQGLKPDAATAGLVMLSYQEGSKKKMNEIKEGLEIKGFKIWMDENVNEKSTPNFTAINSSSVVLIGVTDEYRKSSRCGKEAHHAQVHNIPIIPIQLDEHPQSRTWHGFLQRNKAFDFSKNVGKQELDDLMSLVETLQTGIEPKEEGMPQSTQVEEGELGLPQKPSHEELKPQRSSTPQNHFWVTPYCRVHPNTKCNSEEDDFTKCYCDPMKEVRDWKKKFRLDGHLVKSVTKEDLDILVSLKEKDRSAFYERVWANLRTQKVSELRKIEYALESWQNSGRDLNSVKNPFLHLANPLGVNRSPAVALSQKRQSKKF